MKNVIITINDANLSRIHVVADKLKQEGLDVIDVLPITGIICGKVDEKLMPKLYIDGVETVELDKQMHLF